MKLGSMGNFGRLGRLGLLAGGGGSFSVDQLFQSGAYAGFDFTDLERTSVYGPSSLGVLYTGGGGATAVSASGQAVSAILDKSQGLTVGAALDLDLGDGSAWVNGTGWSVSGGLVVATTATQFQGASLVALTVGKTYLIEFTIDSISGSVGLYAAASGGFPGSGSISTTGAKKFRMRASATTVIFRAETAGMSCQISAPTIKEISGNSVNQPFFSAWQPAYTEAAALRYLLFDGSVDNLTSALVPSATAMTLAIAFRCGGVSQIAMGCSGAAGGYCKIGTDAAGLLAAGWGSDDVATIKDGVGAVDITGTDVVAILTADSESVDLWLNNTLVYSAAPNGSPTTTIPLTIGALNGNGTSANFLNGRVYGSLAVRRKVTGSMRAGLTEVLAASAGITF